MSNPNIGSEVAPVSLPRPREVGRILLGAAGGVLGGALAAAVAFQSSTVAIFGALAGAIGGMIAVQKQHEVA